MIPVKTKRKVVSLITNACRDGANKQYACDLIGISIRTLQRWTENKKDQSQIKEDQRQFVKHIPANRLSSEEKQEIINICNSEEYKSLPPSQIVPDLADKGIYVGSESSFYRVLHEYGQQKHRGKASVRRNNKPEEFIATGPNQVWTWDITYLPTVLKGNFHYLYMITDIYSRKIVGWEVHESQNDKFSSELIRRTYVSESIKGKNIVLHSDNGSPMKGATMLITLQNLGVIPSFNRPSVSNDNPFSESLFKTLKYIPSYPSKPFDSIESARDWVLGFVRWYNHSHHHSSIKYVTPHQRHTGEDHKILENRRKVYREAKKNNSARWSGNIRNWDNIMEVSLNPDNTAKHKLAVQ